MIIVLVIITLACLGILAAVLVSNKKLEQKLAAEKQETERLRQYYESETSRVYNEAQAAVAEAQRLVDQQSADLKQEAERVRQHYEAEARKSQEAAEALVAKTIKDFEPLRKYEHLRDAEGEAQRQLADALKEAAATPSRGAVPAGTVPRSSSQRAFAGHPKGRRYSRAGRRSPQPGHSRCRPHHRRGRTAGTANRWRCLHSPPRQANAGAGCRSDAQHHRRLRRPLPRSHPQPPGRPRRRIRLRCSRTIARIRTRAIQTHG